jgi:hypothetical protein
MTLDHEYDTWEYHQGPTVCNKIRSEPFGDAVGVLIKETSKSFIESLVELFVKGEEWFDDVGEIKFDE